MKIWDPNEKFKCKMTLVGHTAAIICLLLLKEGKIMSGSKDKSINVWDSKENYKCIKTIEAHTATINEMFLLSDGKLVTVSSDKTAKIWEVYY